MLLNSGTIYRQLFKSIFLKFNLLIYLVVLLKNYTFLFKSSMTTRYIIFYSAGFYIHAFSFKVSILEMCGIYYLSCLLFNINMYINYTYLY